MLAVFTSPSRYSQGKGATAALGHEIDDAGTGGTGLIIAGKSVIGLLDRPGSGAWRRPD